MPSYRTLIDLPYLQKGSLGKSLTNDFDKYDLKLDFGYVEATMPFSMKKVSVPRIVYFLSDEVEEVPDQCS